MSWSASGVDDAADNLLRLAQDAGLRQLADRWLSVTTDKSANAGLKVASLVVGIAHDSARDRSHARPASAR